jgi:hypothetical protein
LLPLDLQTIRAVVEQFIAFSTQSQSQSQSPPPPNPASLLIERSVIDSRLPVSLISSLLPPITQHRFLSVHIVTRIVNPDPHKAYELTLFEPLPIDLLSPSFHRFTVTQQSLSAPLESLHPLLVFDLYPFAFLPSICSTVVSLSSFCQPQSEYSSLSSLAVNLTIPPDSITTLTLPCQKKFLSRPYQPTDSSRGVDIPPALITVIESLSSLGSIHSPSASFPPSPSILMTEPWTITMPFPDGSMPFNVIIIVSTTVALLYGSLANVLIRKSSLDPLPPPPLPHSSY